MPDGVRDCATAVDGVRPGRRTVEEARHGQRLETLGLLAAGVAHDVNNLLAVIGNYATLILEPAREAGGVGVPDENGWRRTLADVAQIQGAAVRGSALTSRLLAYARPRADVPPVVSINDVVEDTLLLLRGSMGRNVLVIKELDPGCWPVGGDPLQLGQVLVNLAVNARDAMPDGGTLTVRTANVVRPAGRYVRLEVLDTGTGIAPELADRVFQPFFTTKPQGVGTGLGLSMVRDYVTGVGGEVRLEAPPGGGTGFEIHLPAAGPPDGCS